MQALEYFPGGNTPFGFYNYFDFILPAADANRRIFLKGGPGTGKSTLMKTIAAALIRNGYTVHLLHCSSDPDSLDAIVAPALGFCMADGTAPHICDPIYPGATDEIINLGQFWDAEKIHENKNNIMAVSKEISSAFSSAYDYLASAAHVLEHQTKLALKHADRKGITHRLNALIADLDLQPHVCKPGKIKKGFLSGITPKGIVNYLSVFAGEKIKTIRVKSSFDLSTLFLNPLANLLMQNGADIYLFYCPMQPDSKIEHIYLPEENLLITTKNAYHTCEETADEIDLDEYIDLYPEKHTDTEIINLLLKHAVNSIEKAKSLHDDLERFYVPHMNFNAIQLLANRIIEVLL